jgi:ubiquinone/menaquinone biosynthesis C-methylase UbiE
MADRRVGLQHAIQQYAASSDRLTARIAIHQFGTNPQDWFAWLAERLPLHGNVLEVGAGTGMLWSKLSHDGLDLTLTDFSPAMCAELRQTVPTARVVQCDATVLPLPDRGYDSVIANHMLYHLDEPAAALREFARVLRPGGQLYAALNGRDHLHELRTIGPAIGRPELLRGLVLDAFAAETAAPVVAEHFTDVKVERYPCDLNVPTPEPILTYLDSLTDEPLSAAESDRARDLIQTRVDAVGHYHIRKDTVLITATR